MVHLINKDKVVAEIERRRSKNARNKLNIAAAFEDNYLLSFIGTLEVKEEITTTDTFIEKAWEWVENNVLSINQQDKSRLYFEQFKNYIKGE